MREFLLVSTWRICISTQNHSGLSPDCSLPPWRSWGRLGRRILLLLALFWGSMISCPLQTTLYNSSPPSAAGPRRATLARVGMAGGWHGAGREGMGVGKLKTRPRAEPKIADTLCPKSDRKPNNPGRTWLCLGCESPAKGGTRAQADREGRGSGEGGGACWGRGVASL